MGGDGHSLSQGPWEWAPLSQGSGQRNLPRSQFSVKERGAPGFVEPVLCVCGGGSAVAVGPGRAGAGGLSVSFWLQRLPVALDGCCQ